MMQIMLYSMWRPVVSNAAVYDCWRSEWRGVLLRFELSRGVKEELLRDS